jgi:hypothetical protein
VVARPAPSTPAAVDRWIVGQWTSGLGASSSGIGLQGIAAGTRSRGPWVCRYGGNGWGTAHTPLKKVDSARLCGIVLVDTLGR